jgi:hypothetical protein
MSYNNLILKPRSDIYQAYKVLDNNFWVGVRRKSVDLNYGLVRANSAFDKPKIIANFSISKDTELIKLNEEVLSLNSKIYFKVNGHIVRVGETLDLDITIVFKRSAIPPAEYYGIFLNRFELSLILKLQDRIN